MGRQLLGTALVQGFRYNGQMLYPVPVVADADVLIRDLQYAITADHLPRRLRSASGEYAVFTGVSLFSTRQVFREAIRHLPDVAERTKVSEPEVRAIWNREVVPKVRVVQIDEHAVTDARVAAVRELHRSDAPTAALAVLLAPAVLLTDNRKHFAPFAMPSMKSDSVAKDTVTLSEFGLGARGAMLFPALGGLGAVEGSKKLIAHVGWGGAAVVGLLSVAGLWLFVTSAPWSLCPCPRHRGRPRGWAAGGRDGGGGNARWPTAGRVRGLAGGQGRRVSRRGAAARRRAAGDDDPRDRPGAPQSGLAIRGRRQIRDSHARLVVEQSCFHELSRGCWSLGYHAAELPLEMSA